MVPELRQGVTPVGTEVNNRRGAMSLNQGSVGQKGYYSKCICTYGCEQGEGGSCNSNILIFFKTWFT